VSQMPCEFFKQLVGGEDLFSLQEIERMANRRSAQVPSCPQQTIVTPMADARSSGPVFSVIWVVTNRTGGAM